MSKGGGGSWNSSDDGGSGQFGKVSESGSQSNYYVGSEKTGDHCHMWKSDSGSAGVVHRGECKVCDDEKSSGGK